MQKYPCQWTYGRAPTVLFAGECVEKTFVRHFMCCLNMHILGNQHWCVADQWPCVDLAYRIVIMIHTMCHLCDWFTNHEYWLGMSFNCMHMQNMYKHWLNWCIAKSSFNIQILPLNIWHWFQSHSHLCYWSGRLPPLMVTTASETITFKSLAQMNHSGGKKFLERTTHIISLDCNWYYFRSIHTVLQPTFLMIKSILN